MKNTKPRPSNCFSSTVRELGRPSAVAVETIMAFGSKRCESAACWNHRANCSIGPSARVSSWTISERYCLRIMAGSMSWSVTLAILPQRDG